MNSWNENGGVKESDYITMAIAEHSQRTSYATGKLLTEFFMKDAVDTGKIKGCSIRFANVYSKDERYPKHIIPFIINSFRDNGKVVLLENSRKNKRTFLNNYDSCSAVLALAANTSGGVTGKMISPQTLAVAAAAVGLIGRESELLKFALKYSLILLLCICIITFLQYTVLTWMIP